MAENIPSFEEHINQGIADNDYRRIGEGFEKNIYPHPDNPDKIIGIYRDTEKAPEDREESITTMKGGYYLQKILSILFPDNVLRLNLVTSRPHAVVEDLVTGRELRDYGSDREKLREVFDGLGKIGVWVDPMRKNFMETDDQKIKYVDAIPPWKRYANGSIRRNYSVESIESEALNISDEQKRREVLSSLQRLEELYNEEASSSTKKLD